MPVTAGIDVGTAAVKVALARDGMILRLGWRRIRRRDLRGVVRAAFDEALRLEGLAERDIAYVAATGESGAVEFQSGSFYGMTCHARGALRLLPEARTVLDAGALRLRAFRIDGGGRVLASAMAGPCASGTGQFMENVARYLGFALEEVGAVSLQSRTPERTGGICAVLAETDVVNMVARNVPPADILRGIHLSTADRLARLVRSVRPEGPLAVTGGLSRDAGLLAALGETLPGLEVRTHRDAVFAGAVGAALGAGRRLDRRRGSTD